MPISQMSGPNCHKGGSWSIHLVFAAAFFVSLLLVSVVRAELATPQEMEQVCQNWLVQVTYERGAWAGEIDPHIIQTHEITEDGALLARYYDISPGGFVVVPALKEMVPVKAYSEESVLDERQEGGFLQLLRDMLSTRQELYINAFGTLDAAQPGAGDAVFGRGQRSMWDRFTKSTEEFEAELESSKGRMRAQAGPLLTSSWHQRAPYSNLCPMGDGGRCVVGCVATATAQIINFWQWPSSGLGSHSYIWEGDNSCSTLMVPPAELSAVYSDDYDWAHMPDSCDGGCSPADSAALAELNYEVGVAFEMDYGKCGSGAYTANALNVFPTYYKYSPEITRENRSDHTLSSWFSVIQDEINNGRPAQYRIRSHSIVCDGWRDDGGQNEYHMNYGWGGAFTVWFVLDSLYCYWVLPDSVCPADQEYIITHIMPQDEPIISFVGQTTVEKTGDGDGHAEPGEEIELSATILNSGWDADTVLGKLVTSDPYVDVTLYWSYFDNLIPWGEEATTDYPYVFSVDTLCPDPHIALFELEVYPVSEYLSTDSFYFFIGNTYGFEDDMESGEGFWTHTNITQAYCDEWHQETVLAHSGTTSWKAGGAGWANYGDLQDAALVTPPFLLPRYDAALSFWHWMDAETAWDGGIVMISSGDGNWTQITPDGGYPYSIIDNPANPLEGGTPCFSGYINWTEETFDLSAYSGVVQVMFRFCSDGGMNGPGWYIDDFVITGTSSCCADTMVGDVNCEDDPGVPDIGDMQRLIDNQFISMDSLCCVDEADLDHSGQAHPPATEDDVDITDMQKMIDHLFIDQDPLPACP